MDIWQLNIFCKVVECKSFSKAGKAVHLSQPTVSSHIKELETYFGCRLIDRLGKEAVPTKAGELLYAYARKLIVLRNETEAAMAEFNGTITGSITIGGSTIPGEYILPKIIGAFTKTYPDVTVSLHISDTDYIINQILSGDIEVGVVGAKAGNKKLHQDKLVDDEMHLIVPAKHKWAQRKIVAVRMLAEEPFIVREQGSGTLKSLEISLAAIGLSIDNMKIAAKLGSTTSVIQGIKHNVGLSILSTIAVKDDLKAGALKALNVKGLNLKRSFYVTQHKGRSASPLCKAFIKFIKKTV